MKNKLTYIILLFILACNKISENKPRGFFPVKEFGKWGYINSEGQTLITCQFD